MQGSKDWKDVLKDTYKKNDRQDDPDNFREKKVKARLMYRKRKLEKDVKNYIRESYCLRSRDIERIGRRHGFHIK